MTTCEQYQAQLLAYLYDLLDTDERLALQAHVEQCAACQAAVTQAKAQQQLLAAAAKKEFAGVKFEAPAEHAPAQTTTPVLRIKRVRRASSAWAIAASVLVLVGIGASGGWWTTTYWQEKHIAQAREEAYKQQVALLSERVAERTASVADATKQVQELDQQVVRLQFEAANKWVELTNKVQNQSLNVVLTGPAAVQPGARNEYQIHAYAGGQPVAARVATRVLDEHRKVLFEQSVAMNGAYFFALPTDLPVKDDKKLFLEIAAERSDGQKQEIREEVALIAPVYLTHLTTDKPMYRPGETVYFRTLTLERFSLKPAHENLHLIYAVTDGNGSEVFHQEGSPQLHDANNQALLGPDKKPIQGIGAGEYAIAPGASGGEYTLTVREAGNRFPPQQRKFIVNQYRNPLMNKELDFTRKSYGPAEEVVAACKVTRAENKDVPIANRPITATIQIDGKSYGADGKEGTQPFRGRTDARGAVNVRFKLPTVMEHGLGTLSVQFTDGANYDTLVKPIPIVLKKLDIHFFPEGGDLIAGVPNRVYFQVRSMLGKPAEVLGKIVDQQGKVVAGGVQTLHDDEKPGVNQGVNQGMGLFAFTPEAGKTYELKIDAPSGMEGKYTLPKVGTDGVVLAIPTGVTSAKESIQVALQSPDKDRDLLVGAYCRGRLMDHQTVSVKKGETAKVELHPTQAAGGVYRVTVFEETAGLGNRKQLTPRAERLVYHAPSQQLILNAKPDKKLYVPGDKVTLNLSSLNESEQAAPVIAMVAVVDESVIKLADEKTYRTMPTHYYLTTEVQRPEDLEYADFLLSSHPKAAAALDLLLGTQGWRRFAEQDPGQFRQKNGADAERLLATTGQATQSSTNLLQHEAERLQNHYATTLSDLQEKRNKSSAALVALRDDKTFPEKLATLHERAKGLWRDHRLAAERLEAHLQLIPKLRSLVMPVVAVALIAATLVLLVSAVRRSNLLGALPLYASAALGVLLVIGLFTYTPREQAQDGPGLAMAPSAPVINVPEAAPQTMTARGETRDKMLPKNLDALGERPLPEAADAPARDGALRPEGAAQLQLLEPKMAKAKGEAEKLGVAKNGAPRFHALRNPAKPAAPLAAAPAMPREAAEKKFEVQKEARAPEALKKDIFQADKDAAKRELQQAPAFQDARRAGLEAEIAQLQKQALGNAPMARLQAVEAMRPWGIGQFGRGMGGAGFGGGGLGFGGRMAGGMGGPGGPNAFFLVAPPPPAVPLLAREFAYQGSAIPPGQGRFQFADTVYWHPALVLPDGKGQVSFDLSGSVTGYQATVFAHTLDGRIGAVTSLFEARKPLTVEPKLPIEVTSSDIIDVPVSIANNTPDGRPVNVHVSASGLNLAGADNTQLMLPADGRSRRLFRFRPALVEGKASVSIDGVSGPFVDRVTRDLAVVPDGFPIVHSHSDILEGAAQQEVVLPESWLKGTLKCHVQVFPSTLADLQKGLEALLREPGGCFEQTSSSNYPNVLILNYLKESEQTKPDLERRARELLANGYQRLVAFECEDPNQPKRRGYEWFGGKAAPHEALTAYGLLEFRDMARVYDVDTKMIERSRQYLMSRKDGKGGFQRNPAAIDTFGRAPDDITNAYIVWA
ncbi:MAG TPA: alpha-2-macroglobulin family protein, partial [Gemmataceae bacterium]|nr:alpha-2-macroglobulin family protein [Gemmataceae bacterium]